MKRDLSKYLRMKVFNIVFTSWITLLISINFWKEFVFSCIFWWLMPAKGVSCFWMVTLPAVAELIYWALSPKNVRKDQVLECLALKSSVCRRQLLRLWRKTKIRFWPDPRFFFFLNSGPFYNPSALLTPTCQNHWLFFFGKYLLKETSKQRTNLNNKASNVWITQLKRQTFKLFTLSGLIYSFT